MGLVTCLLIIIIEGCTSYSLIKPLTPSAGNPNSDPEIVSSLSPTLTWEPAADSNITYDLIIYEKIEDEPSPGEIERRVGNRVYYEEGIAQAKHAVRMPLNPATEYYWSIRVRKGNEISEWSRYDYSKFLLFDNVNVHDTFFRFKTPNTLP